jgi:dihydrolipoamide dehydrogenase
MAEIQDIVVPDIGDVADVEIIEIHVKAGDSVQVEDPLVTLESDKATMDIPAETAGRIESFSVNVGDRVTTGAIIGTLAVDVTADEVTHDEGTNETPAAAAEPSPGALSPAPSPSPAPAPAANPGPAHSGTADFEVDVVVLGAGPGGYTAAFRSADLGLNTALVERYENLGGVCLNVGCIPSKALLHTAEVISGARAMASHGVDFGEPTIDLAKLASWKSSVVKKLTRGLSGLAKQRKVQTVQGVGRFTSPNTIEVDTAEGLKTIRFTNAIIAAGSQATSIPVFPNDDPRLMDSTDALELQDIPERMLVVGGGIIGLEMATVYAALGTKITVVELLDGLMPGCDRDLVKVLQKHIAPTYENIFLETRVAAIEPEDSGLRVRFEGPKAPESDVFDRVLVAVGRRPNGHKIGADAAGVNVDQAGFIAVDRQCRTNVPHIFAIGDIVGQPMLAHKATHEGKVAAEVISGHKASFDALTIPSVAYTDPEVAWMGITEEEAKAQGLNFEKAVFPWAASGRAIGNGREEGLTKLLFDAETRRIIGAGIVGIHAGDLISETVLAMEMGADAEDIGLTIHPHPTLSETINFAAEMAEGTITDLYIPKKKK